MQQRIRIIFLIIGLVSIVAMCLGFDVSFVELWANICRAGYWLVAIIVLWAVLYVMNTLAWRIIIRGSGECTVPFWRLLRLTVIGFALNYATPAGLLGGEPFKIMAMSKHIGAERATSSVVLFSMMHIFAHFCYWVSAILLYVALAAGGILPHDVFTTTILVLISVFCTAGIYLFTRGYKNGMVLRLVGFVARLPWLGSWGKRFMANHAGELENIDRQIAGLHAQNRKSFYASLALEYVGRMLQSLEIYFILIICGHEASVLNFAFAMLILAFTSLFANLLFFFPLQLGGREGGFAMSTAQMGLTTSVGLCVSVLCRVREIFWVAVGMLLLMKERK